MGIKTLSLLMANSNILKQVSSIVGVITLLSMVLPAWGQPTLRDSLFEAIKAEVEPMVSASLSGIAYQPSESYNFFVLDAVLNLRDESLERINRDAIHDLRIRQVERDWGLVVRTQVSHNFSDFNIVNDEVDEQAFPTRLRLGLDLDLMKGGYFAHKNQAKQLNNQKEMEWLEFDSRRNQERSFYRQNVLVYFFNQEKIKILNERMGMLTKQLDMLYAIYYIRDILFEEVLWVKSKLEQAQVVLRNYQDFNATLESTLNLRELSSKVEVTKLPLMDIDARRLLNDTIFDSRTNRLLDLESVNNGLKNAWVNDVTLRVQANQNLAMASEGRFDRFYPSVGLVAAVPVETLFGNSGDRELHLAEKNYEQRFREYEQLANATEILNLASDYRLKMKSYVELLYKNMLFEEKLRIELLNRTRFTEYYQPFEMLRHYDALHEIRLELLDTKQQLYLILLKIYARTPLKSLRPYLYPVALNQYFVKLAGSRTIFINKADFSQFDRNFIDNYLRFNDFQFAILSEPIVIDLNEQVPTINLPKGSEIRFVQTVLWRPSMIYPEKSAADLVGKMKKNGLAGFVLYLHESDVNGLGSIRLSELTRQMTDFLVEVDRVEPQMPVFLSVPASFDVSNLVGLGPWVEKIVVRLEKDSDLERLRALPTQVLPFHKLPICVALDVNRFENRLKMEAFISQVVKKYPVDDIIFNDFQAFVTMDTKILSQ